MMKELNDKLAVIDKEISEIKDIKKSLDDRIKKLNEEKQQRVEEVKKLAGWALQSDDENISELRDQWLMAAKIIYGDGEGIDHYPDNAVLNQREVDGVLQLDELHGVIHTNASHGEEPSMEDILASIRRILSENDDDVDEEEDDGDVGVDWSTMVDD